MIMSATHTLPFWSLGGVSVVYCALPQVIFLGVSTLHFPWFHTLCPLRGTIMGERENEEQRVVEGKRGGRDEGRKREQHTLLIRVRS